MYVIIFNISFALCCLLLLELIKLKNENRGNTQSNAATTINATVTATTESNNVNQEALINNFDQMNQRDQHKYIYNQLKR